LPQIPEAVALNFIDDIDSKMAGMRMTLEQAAAGSSADLWTERNPSLRRALLRADRFLAATDSSAGQTADALVSKAAVRKG